MHECRPRHGRRSRRGRCSSRTQNLRAYIQSGYSPFSLFAALATESCPQGSNKAVSVCSLLPDMGVEMCDLPRHGVPTNRQRISRLAGGEGCIGDLMPSSAQNHGPYIIGWWSGDRCRRTCTAFHSLRRSRWCRLHSDSWRLRLSCWPVSAGPSDDSWLK